MMNQDTFEWYCLCLPLPYYKVTEPFPGAPMMTKAQAEYVLKKMNEQECKCEKVRNMDTISLLFSVSPFIFHDDLSNLRIVSLEQFLADLIL